MGIVVRWGYEDYLIFKNGKWRGFDPYIVARMNQALQENPIPPHHPDPDHYAYELAKKTSPSFWQYEVTFTKDTGHPDDRPPTWLQCLFNPPVRRVYLRDLLSGPKNRR
jgi:hypothetical protein